MAEQSGGSRKSQVQLLVDYLPIKLPLLLLLLTLLITSLLSINLNEAANEKDARHSNIQKRHQQQQQQQHVRSKRHLLQPVGRVNPIDDSEVLQLNDLTKRKRGQLKLSHHILCEPISQLNDLKLVCPNDNQFIVILEAYYSDLYPEIVCPKANSESKLNKLTGSQLVSIFKQLYSTESSPLKGQKDEANDNEKEKPLIKFNPTLSYGSQRPFCIDDLKQSFQAKCSGRQRCSFSRNTDHQFPNCVKLKPGHVFARYLCIDDALLVKYCNADELLASHTSVANRVKRSANYNGDDDNNNDDDDGELAKRDKRQSLFSDLPVQLDPSEQEAQIDTLDFGFVASPGYPIFYATPTNSDNNQQEQYNNEQVLSSQMSNCGWTIEAELGQRITVKLLDASLAPNAKLMRGLADQDDQQDDYTTSNSLFPLFESGDTTSGGRQISNNMVTPALVGDSVVITSVTTSLNNPTHSLTSSSLAGGSMAAEAASKTSQEKLNDLSKQMSANTSNVYFENINQDNYGVNNNNITNYKFTNPSNKRIMFKIDEYDYEIIKNNLAIKLQQVADQCQGYDQLILRDSLFPHSNVGSSLTKLKSKTTSGSSHSTNSEEFELISKLPITLYKNNLIDFSNHSIYHKLSNPSSFSSSDNNQANKDGNYDEETSENDNYLKHMLYKRVTKPSTSSDNNQNNNLQQLGRRIDYQALLGSLNPLQLSWLYQHNVTLCSTNQLDQLSSPQQKNKISFKSSGNTITLDLVSGHMFNPNNRGILFWYHKHGCPATLKIPHRVRLVFRNETTEIFHCFQGFVFNDTRQNVRVRQCSQHDQTWRDTSYNINLDGHDGNDNDYSNQQANKINSTPGQIPPCVYIEDIANSNNVAGVDSTTNSKFDRLVATDNHGLNIHNNHPANNQHRVTSNGNDVAVEVVGVPTPETSLYPDLQNDIDIFGNNQHPQMSASSNGKVIKQTNSSSSFNLPNLWNSMLEYMTFSEQYSDGTRSIMTHQPLKEQRTTTDNRDSSFWLRIGTLFDRRLLAPAIAVLFLFILINLIIYVIFLVALPKFARLFCSKSGLTSGRHLARNRDGTMSSKLSHYESDYSVTMGMSL